MYTPQAFRETDDATLHDFIDQHPFAIVASANGTEIQASHLPLLLDRESGLLWGHMAKANNHCRDLLQGPVLCVFSGPFAYVSPQWYGEPNTVPTVNYVAVHVHGNATLVEEPGVLRELLGRQTQAFETGDPAWSVDDLDEDFLEKLLKMIVGFRIDIQRIDGKWKLSQNHSEQRRRRVVESLRQSRSENCQDIARLMELTTE
jgi:transcriptional regulator